MDVFDFRKKGLGRAATSSIQEPKLSDSGETVKQRVERVTGVSRKPLNYKPRPASNPFLRSNDEYRQAAKVMARDLSRKFGPTLKNVGSKIATSARFAKGLALNPVTAAALLPEAVASTAAAAHSVRPFEKNDVRGGGNPLAANFGRFPHDADLSPEVSADIGRVLRASPDKHVAMKSEKPPMFAERKQGEAAAEQQPESQQPAVGPATTQGTEAALPPLVEMSPEERAKMDAGMYPGETRENTNKRGIAPISASGTSFVEDNGAIQRFALGLGRKSQEEFNAGLNNPYVGGQASVMSGTINGRPMEEVAAERRAAAAAGLGRQNQTNMMAKYQQKLEELSRAPTRAVANRIKAELDAMRPLIFGSGDKGEAALNAARTKAEQAKIEKLNAETLKLKNEAEQGRTSTKSFKAIRDKYLDVLKEAPDMAREFAETLYGPMTDEQFSIWSKGMASGTPFSIQDWEEVKSKYPAKEA